MKSWKVTSKSFQILRSRWAAFPEQVKRLLVILILVLVALTASRRLFVPQDFGTYGHYRTSAATEALAEPKRYAGHEACEVCHEAETGAKARGYHRNVSCEVCHGPSAPHAEDPSTPPARIPHERGFCPLCHEFQSSRPTGFPQILPISHNPMKPCAGCHDPHDPKPPHQPKECGGCHATIERTKGISHHVNIPCTRCHETPNGHKDDPRTFLATKPTTREFCGGCHAEGSVAEKEIPRVNLATHEPRYLCWQCHYPHLPEAK